MKQVTLTLHRETEKGRIVFTAPSDSYDCELLRNILRTCQVKHNDFVKVTFDTPKKPRTTGKDSQNSHIWGHASQIAQETGNDLTDVMDCAKERAIKRGYPYHVNNLNGKIKPYGVEELDTVQAGYLIEELHQIAGEMEIYLKEE